MKIDRVTTQKVIYADLDPEEQWNWSYYGDPCWRATAIEVELFTTTTHDQRIVRAVVHSRNILKSGQLGQKTHGGGFCEEAWRGREPLNTLVSNLLGLPTTFVSEEVWPDET